MAASGGLTPGVLNHQEILDLCGLVGEEKESDGLTGPVRPCRRDRVRSASYDMRLGAEFHFTEPGGSRWTRTADVSRLKPGSSESLVIPPNQVVVISTLEKLVLPNDMIGHLTLKQDILLEGLLMGSQSQVDAGYEGWIYPLLYNLTDSDVTLKFGEPVVRLELVRLPHPTDKPYKGTYLDAPLSKALRKPIGSSLSQLRERVEAERKRVTVTRIFATAASIFVIALPFLTGFVGEVNETRDRVSKVEGEVNRSVQLEETVDSLKSRIERLECQAPSRGAHQTRHRDQC